MAHFLVQRWVISGIGALGLARTLHSDSSALSKTTLAKLRRAQPANGFGTLPGARPDWPGLIEPVHPRTSGEAARDERWSHEVKVDGYPRRSPRAIKALGGSVCRTR